MTLARAWLCCLAVATAPGVARAQTDAGAKPPASSAPGAPGRTPASLPAILSQRADAEVLAQSVLLLTGNNELSARRIGARALLDSAGPEARQRLMDVLCRKPDDPAAQTAVCLELAATSNPAAVWIDPVLLLAASPREDLGRAAAMALLRFAPQDVIPRLKSAASRGNGDAGARRAAVAALGCMGASPAAVGGLVELLDDPDGETRAAVLAAIERATGVHQGGPDEARAWWKANRTKPLEQWLADLQLTRDRALRDMEARLHDLSRRLCDRFKAEYLQTPDGQKSQRLVAMLGDAEPAVRMLGLELTDALITDRKPVPPEVAQQVRTVLADAQPDLRRRAALILGSIRDAADAATLRAALQREPIGRVRAGMIRALARMGEESALDDLVAALSDPSEEVVIEAVAGIGLLCERLPPENAASRGRAAAAIAGCFEGIKQPSATLTVAFLDAMRLVGDARFRNEFSQRLAASQPSEVRQAAIRGAAATGDASLTDRVAEMLADESPAVRLAAARELGRGALSDAQLERLLGRLPDGVEPVEQVRSDAWESFVRGLRNRPLPDRVGWARRIATEQTGAAASDVLELLAQLDRQCADDPNAAAVRPTVRTLLADRLAAEGRHADAAVIYDELLASPPDDWRALGARAVRCNLRAGRLDAAVALIRREYAAPAPASTPAGQLMDAGLSEARRMADEGLLSAAGDALQRLRAELSDLMSPAQQAALSAAAAEVEQARKAAAARAIDADVAALRLGGAEWRQAHDRLVAGGRDSLAALAAALASPAASTGPAAEGEQRLVACVREIEPAWAGFASDADPTTRDAAVNDLRQRLAVAGGQAGTGSSDVRTP